MRLRIVARSDSTAECMRAGRGIKGVSVISPSEGLWGGCRCMEESGGRSLGVRGDGI